MKIEMIMADYKDPIHAKSIIMLMDTYAQDAMGGGVPLTREVKTNLVGELAKMPGAFTVLCHVETKPAGLVNCFAGFSTFKCKPLLNIHDVIVHPYFRGHGISQLMLERVEKVANDRGCCKLTLEVLEGNHVAQKSYRKFGFDGYELDPDMGKALFWEKVIG